MIQYGFRSYKHLVSAGAILCLDDADAGSIRGNGCVGLPYRLKQQDTRQQYSYNEVLIGLALWLLYCMLVTI